VHEHVTAKTQLAQAQIGVTEAQTLLKNLGAEATGGARLTVRAPINGVVVESKLAVGQAVNVDGLLARVADLSTLIAVVNVPETHINALRVGMNAQITDQQNQTVSSRQSQLFRRSIGRRHAQRTSFYQS
jgi:cobalt-zinc-cadmium efflux system membrane fusion protein